MAGGYCLGQVFTLESAERRKVLVRIGLGMAVAFVVLRAINVYGDLFPRAAQHTPVFTALSFLNVTKYPPSLDFLLMTLGPALVALGLLDRVRLSPANPLVVFGRTPFFYFLGHMALAHLAEVLLTWFRYGNVSFVFTLPPALGGSMKLLPPGFGFDLWVVYAVWLAVVIAMYPLCLWFAGLKQRRSDWWLSYL
jgi:uncharacterized membrane protein